MKRLLKILFVSLVMFIFFNVSVYAVESNIDEYKEEFKVNEIFNEIDSETAEILNEIGINNISAEAIFKVTPTKLFESFFSIFKNSLRDNLKYIFICVAIILITNLMVVLGKMNDSVSVIGSCILALSLTVPIGNLISLSFSVIEVLSNFTVVFAGAFCAIVSSGGYTVTANNYLNLTVFSNAFFTGVLKEFSSPLVNSMCSLGFLSSFDTFNLTTKLSEIIKKIYVYLIGFIGTVFSGIITIKGVLGGSVDTLSSKSIRFVVGKSLPLVGGAVSETYSTLISGLSLIKNTVGVFGILTVIFMVLPSVFGLAIWILTLDFMRSLTESLGESVGFDILKIFKDILVLLLATVAIITAIFIVSVGIVIAVKGGGVY